MADTRMSEDELVEEEVVEEVEGYNNDEFEDEF